MQRVCSSQPCTGQALPHTQAVKLNPSVLPGVLLVGAVGGGLPWQYQKALAGFHRVAVFLGIQYSFAEITQ